ncbi:uncharacterized protein LOC127241735 isoform X2 [Andrographis paniculata]|uniref:uncharacterized protein LOC127241735 isoform X2 n=1 Tax=Andrographis paniculata TaxID=175694 RepID=UPI0021E9906D|nr:uncharacterized protein LOC127241735 isoform X2 [Andrographis paniculata]
MDLELSCTSSLPWIWAVETLAHADHIDTYLLIDLLEKTPEIGDDIGRNAREAVSLKILENFLVQRAPAIPESSSHSIEKIMLEPSENCEDVLKRMLAECKQASPSCLKLADLEINKWNLQPFIRHKRSSLAVYTLKQLKDAILTGKNPLLASLKEQSGLSVGNQPQNGARIDGVTCNGITPGLSTNDERLLPVNTKRKVQSESAEGTSFENQIEPNNGSVKKHKPDAVFTKPYVNDKNMPSGEDTQCASAAFMEQNDGDRCNSDKNMPSGEDAQYASAASMEHSDGDKCNLDKTNHIASVGIDEPPEDDNDRQQTSPKGLARVDEVLHTEKEHEYDIGKTNGDDISSGKGGINYDGADFATKNTSLDHQLPANCNECTSSEGLGGCDEVPHQELNPRCDTDMQNDKFDGKQMKDHDVELDKFEQNISRKSPNVSEAEGVNLSRDSDELLDEDTSIDELKRTFLCSQPAYSQDPLATTDWTELDLCMKCNKGGDLLVCSSHSCPIVIHVSCLGSDAVYDTNGKFYCPFCAYSQAVAKYVEVKKQASLARKHVATFIRIGTSKESEEHSDRLHRTEQNQQEPDDGLCRSNKVKSDAKEKVRNRQQRKELENEPGGPSGVHSCPNLRSRRSDISSTNRTAHGLDKDNQEGEKGTEISQSLRIHEEPQKDELGIHNSLIEKTSHQVSKRSDVSENYVDIRSKKGDVSPRGTDEQIAEKVRNKMQRKKLKNESAGPSGMHSGHNLRSRRNGISPTDRIAHGLDKEKQEGRKTTEISQSMRIHEERHKDELGFHNSLIGKTSHQVSKRSDVSENYVNIRSKKGAVSPRGTDEQTTKKVRKQKQTMELERESAGPSGMHSGHNLRSRRNDISPTDKISHGLDKDNQEGKRSTDISQSLRNHEEQQKDELGINKSLREKTSHQVSKRSGVSENYLDIRSKKGALPLQETDEQKDLSSKSDTIELFETSDEDFKCGSSGTSKYSTRLRKQKVQPSYPTIPPLRRKKLPWTSAEENALKEGVRLLSNPGDKIMPWTKILEFGTGVFDRSRTAIDLKDKWRNMCKAGLKG